MAKAQNAGDPKTAEIDAILELLEEAGVSHERLTDVWAWLCAMPLPHLKRKHGLIHEFLEDAPFMAEQTAEMCVADQITTVVLQQHNVDDVDDISQKRRIWRWRSRYRQEQIALLRQLEKAVDTSTPLDVSKLRRCDSLAVIEERIEALQHWLDGRGDCQPALEEAMAVSGVKEHL